MIVGITLGTGLAWYCACAFAREDARERRRPPRVCACFYLCSPSSLVVRPQSVAKQSAARRVPAAVAPKYTRARAGRPPRRPAPWRRSRRARRPGTCSSARPRRPCRRSYWCRVTTAPHHLNMLKIKLMTRMLSER